MKCLYVVGISTECPLSRGVHLWEVKMQCLYVAETSTECPLRRGVHLREVSVSSTSTV